MPECGQALYNKIKPADPGHESKYAIESASNGYQCCYLVRTFQQELDKVCVETEKSTLLCYSSQEALEFAQQIYQTPVYWQVHEAAAIKPWLSCFKQQTARTNNK